MRKNLFLFVCLFFLACGSRQNISNNEPDAVPKGDPSFTPLTTSWIIDNANAIPFEVEEECNKICQSLQDDGIAEMVVLIQLGINKPTEYATHYGRWLKLGKKGPSVEGGNNGIVWLIMPDADEKLCISIGRGLPKFTSVDYGEIMDSTIHYFNFHNYLIGVKKLVSLTDKKLREIYIQK